LRADHAASFTRPVQQTLWWDAQASDNVRRWPWNRIERQALTDNGVHLHDEDTQLTWLGNAWPRPILAATERCILVIHEDADRHHPILDQVNSCVANLDTYRLGDSALHDKLHAQLEPLKPLVLPGKQRWWQLPAATDIAKRQWESFSSLDSLIYSPYQWLLRYAARIRPGSLTSLSEGSMLKGNLAHRLIEHYFMAHTDIAAIQLTAVSDWVDSNVHTLLQTEGATLLEPGNQAECERFISQLKDALLTLVDHLQQAAVVTVETEIHQTGNFVGGELSGYIDLLVTRTDSTEAVIDIKWGGRDYRRKSLQESNYLQLATYAHFRYSDAGKSLPALSYFIIMDAWMLNLNHDYFPSAESVAPVNEEGWGEFWQRFETSWRWRREQLDKGLVEVTVTGTELTEDSTPDEAGLEMPDASDSFNDYAVLTGWEPGA
jgi:ATP-dependent helicase/nuclease subunit B